LKLIIPVEPGEAEKPKAEVKEKPEKKRGEE